MSLLGLEKGLVVQWTASPHMPLCERTHMPAGSKQLVVASVEIVEQMDVERLATPEFEEGVASDLGLVVVAVRRGQVEEVGQSHNKGLPSSNSYITRRRILGL